MKPKTEELLYFLLWSCDQLSRPTFRNLTSSFESWMYANGFQRQLNKLERELLVERSGATSDERVHRLTAQGRLHALGGRDPEARWRRPWDGRWRLALFDVPMRDNTQRVKLRRYLKHRGFGYLQNSVWITPDPIKEERDYLAGSTVDVSSLLFLEARPAAGESDAEIVAGAWDFEQINQRYSKYLRVLENMPGTLVQNEASARTLRRWANLERNAWLTAMTVDPLLPEQLLPEGYLGRRAWQARVRALARAAAQRNSFRL